MDDVKFVTQQELVAMMDDPSLLWSPWFRIIVDELLVGGANPWWGDLKGCLHSDKFLDTKTIYAFQPPFKQTGKLAAAKAQASAAVVAAGGGAASTDYEHLGCYRPSMVGSVPQSKQGAYGKLTTHEESKASQLLRLDEVFTALLFKVSSPLKGKVDPQRFGPGLKADVEFCDMMLGKVSRSFAAVIRQLPQDLVLDCLVFYLVLRALDTVEDDMNAFESVDQKLFFLQDFYGKALHNDKWKMQGVGEGDEALLLENFFKVSKVFQALPQESQNVIDDINKRMGAGMARCAKNKR